MCKEIKRLTLLSECPHLNKTDRDSIIWAIYQIQPPEVEPEKGFDGFDFSSWPAMPYKKTFAELTKARRAKKGDIMTQAYIDFVAVHLHELYNSGVSIDKALKIATVGGWTSLKASWVFKELENEISDQKKESNTPAAWINKVKKLQVTSRSQMPKEIRLFIDTQFRLNNYPADISLLLSDIGFKVSWGINMVTILREEFPTARKAHDCMACEWILSETGIDGYGFTRPDLRVLAKARRNNWKIKKAKHT